MLIITLQDVLKALVTEDESTITSIRNLNTGTIYLRLAEQVKPFLDVFGCGWKNVHSVPLPGHLVVGSIICFTIDGVPRWFEAKNIEYDGEIVWVIEYVIDSSSGQQSAQPEPQYLYHYLTPLRPVDVYQCVELMSATTDLPADLIRETYNLRKIYETGAYTCEQWDHLQRELIDRIDVDDPAVASLFTLFGDTNAITGRTAKRGFVPFSYSKPDHESRLYDRRFFHTWAEYKVSSWHSLAIRLTHHECHNETRKFNFVGMLTPIVESLVWHLNTVVGSMDPTNRLVLKDTDDIIKDTIDMTISNIFRERDLFSDYIKGLKEKQDMMNGDDEFNWKHDTCIRPLMSLILSRLDLILHFAHVGITTPEEWNDIVNTITKRVYMSLRTGVKRRLKRQDAESKQHGSEVLADLDISDEDEDLEAFNEVLLDPNKGDEVAGISPGGACPPPADVQAAPRAVKVDVKPDSTRKDPGVSITKDEPQNNKPNPFDGI